MNLFVIGVLITVSILLLLFGKPAVDTIRTIRANKKLRTEMFECIGAEWIMRMNTLLADLSVDRDPNHPIQERFYKESNGWMFLVPARNIATGAPFALVVGTTAPIAEPKPHVKTILMDLIIATRDRPEWWLEGRCTKVFPDTQKVLARQGVIFDIAEEGPS